MLADVGALATGVASALAFGYKLRHLRRRSAEPGAAALRALVTVLGLSAVLAVLSPRFVGAVLDQAVGLPGVTRLVANVFSMGTCLAIVA